MFKDLFNDDNKVNEKSVAGFIALAMMIVTLVADIIAASMAVKLPIHEFIFNGFLILCIGALGIASIDKWINKTK